jgi:hypothetical protein
MKKLIFDMVKELENILAVGIATLLWANDDAVMERVPCRVNRERITM